MGGILRTIDQVTPEWLTRALRMNGHLLHCHAGISGLEVCRAPCRLGQGSPFCASVAGERQCWCSKTARARHCRTRNSGTAILVGA